MLPPDQRPSWFVAAEAPDNTEVKLKVENKYCEDLASALRFWNSDAIVDAYFHQAVSQTEEEQKMRMRLRNKKIRNRMGSITMDSRIGDMGAFIDQSGDTSRHQSTITMDQKSLRHFSGTTSPLSMEKKLRSMSQV